MMSFPITIITIQQDEALLTAVWDELMDEERVWTRATAEEKPRDGGGVGEWSRWGGGSLNGLEE